MYSTSDYTGVYAQVQEILGEFWHDFEIDEIISRAYEFDGTKYVCKVSDEEFWKIAAECDKCATECGNTDYDYRAALRNDIREAVTEYDLSEFDSRDKAEEYLHEALWIDDAVTGNASGSYTFNTWRAENYLAHNWDLLAEAVEDYGDAGVNILAKGAESCDVMIRCHLLGECLSVVLDELESVGVVEWNR